MKLYLCTIYGEGVKMIGWRFPIEKETAQALLNVLPLLNVDFNLSEHFWLEDENSKVVSWNPLHEIGKISFGGYSLDAGGLNVRFEYDKPQEEYVDSTIPELIEKAASDYPADSDTERLLYSCAVSLAKIADRICIDDPLNLNRPMNEYGENIVEGIQNGIERGLRGMNTWDRKR